MLAKKALYLTGGGARGAYQAGVLKGIGHILQTKTLPFTIVSGVSIGSLNAAVLAENANDFPAALDKLEQIWKELRCQRIYKASNFHLSKSVVRNMTTMMIKQHHAGHLLDTSPLKQMVSDYVDFTKIANNLAKGSLNTLEVISHCYETHQTISFYQHTNLECTDWNYPRHRSQRANIGADHILASIALPSFFPTVPLEGFHYGDGCISLTAPLRGAIHFEANKIMILGTRCVPTFADQEVLRNHGDIPFSHILGSMLTGLFLDNLDLDVEMVNKMNEITTLLSMWKKHRSPWRPISTLYLRPSKDLASLAQKYFKTLPVLLRYLLNILGAKNHSGDLLSILLFEGAFTQELFELGYQDSINQAKEVAAFFT